MRGGVTASSDWRSSVRWPPSMSILPADRCSRSGWETLALTTFPAGQHACQAEGTSARRDCPGHQIT